MRILFAALHNGYYRNLDSVIDELARRGHGIYLGAERQDSAFGGQPVVDALAATHDNVSHGPIAVRDADSLFLPAKIRFGIDYLRYLDPMYSRSSGLLPRMQERTPTGILRLARSPVLRVTAARRVLQRTLDAIDRAVEPSDAIERFMDAQQPDLVVITPLIGLVASSQLDLLRSALRRRVAVAVVVWSWDHLSSKAVIRDVSDALFVWNDIQKREATEMHQFPAARVVVTGAQCFDRWFNRAPSRPRSEFLRHVGLTEDRPFVLWAGSALLPGSPREPDVFMRWISHLRHSTDPAVRDVPVLLRPHPARTAEWVDVDWRSAGHVAMFGAAPVDDESRTDYFDSLYHAGAVVGITTSAFLEAGIVGRPVLSFYAEDLIQEHEDSLHFQHLLKGGLVTMAASMDEHGRQLAQMLAGPPADVLERQRRFVASFVRPRGLDTPATRIVADALERLPDAPRVGPGHTTSLFGVFGLRAVRAMERSKTWRPFILDEREIERDARTEAKARIREEALARKRAAKAAKLAKLSKR